MAPTRSLLLSGVALTLIMGSASIPSYGANGTRHLPIVLAAADDGVAAAQANVDAARAALEAAKASGQGVEEAQKALEAAMAALKQAEAVAKQAPVAVEPPPEKAPVEPPVAAEPKPPKPPVAEVPAPPKPPVAEAPAAVPEPPVAAEPAPPPPPVANEPTPPKEPVAQGPEKGKKKKPPVAEAPAAPAEPPVAAEPTPPKPPVAEAPAAPEPPVAAEPVPPKPPVAEAPVPPKPPVAEAPAAPAQPPVAGEPTPPKPPVAEAPGKQPPPPVAGPAAPPPVAGPAAPPPVADSAKAPVPVVDATTQEQGGKRPPKSIDGRIIVKEGDDGLFIRHDEDARFRIPGAKFGTQTAPDGTTITTIIRPDGSQIVTITDQDGNLIRRTRKLPNGQVIVLIDSRPEAPEHRRKTIDYFKRLPPVVLNIPEQDYVVESRRATPRQLELTLEAPPVEQVERTYSIDEIRQSERLRDKVRRVDIDTVTFDTGQAVVPPDQINNLSAIGSALAAIIKRDPSQVYLIEGHTDAVGSDVSNLALSDRRAESVADILATYYGIPAENLVTQGYGEQYLKVPTEAPERQNRRVTVRNITPLLNANKG